MSVDGGADYTRVSGGTINGARYEFRASRPDYVVPDFAPLWRPEVTYISNGWGFAVADIGPELATAMLALNVSNQRNKIGASIDRFARDMEAGQWRLTHQAIAFNRAGQLHDGQNRLTAVVRSGSTVPFLVAFGAGGNEEMVVIDTGKARTPVDAGRVLGMDVDKDIVATISNAFNLARAGRTFQVAKTNCQVIDLVVRYGGTARLINGWFHGSQAPGVNRAPVRAAVLAAIVCGASEAAMERFSGVLTDKLPAATEPVDGPPRVLRQYIVNHVRGGPSTYSTAVDLYMRTCHAIQNVVAGRDMKITRAISDSPFVLPENR